jgi:DNA-binding XRE family transcriptional regulator
MEFKDPSNSLFHVVSRGNLKNYSEKNALNEIFKKLLTCTPDWGRRNGSIGTRSVPIYKNPTSFTISLRISRYPSKTLGEQIKKWRLEHDLFQRNLAEMIGVDEMTIVNWEKGKTKPLHEKVKKLNEIINFSK